jgi:ATP-binding cassette, subfamily C (CFTR/MRP), member 1
MLTSSAKRIPYADHIIALDADGAIDEQGRFEFLNATGGYISQFNLSPPDWSQPTDDASTAFNVDSNGELDVPEDVLESNENLEAAANKATGDFSIYGYYMKSVGWFPVVVFVFFISGFIFCISFPSRQYPCYYILLGILLFSIPRC